MGSYFIKIEDGPDVRRRILESSKASLHTLKGYHALLKVRGEKQTHMNMLRTQMKELTMLINRAEALLPQLSEREIAELQPKAKPAPMKPVATQPQGKWVKKGKRKVFVGAPKVKLTVNVPVLPELPEPEKAKPMSELERLEKALAGIEGKLGNI